MNKKLRERGIRRSLKFKNTVLAAKFTPQFPVLSGLQQARRCCVLPKQGKNAVLCMDGLIHSHNADEITDCLTWSSEMDQWRGRGFFRTSAEECLV